MSILKEPRITEKASNLLGQNVYTFDVTDSATKAEIKKAVFAMYKVHAVKVNVLPVPKKNVMYRGRPGSKKGGRKALVYLKAGDKIEFV
jgi:large subunit ribosomal protein L23